VSADAMANLLRQRDVRYVDWAAWKRLVALEAALGVGRVALTIKVAEREAMMGATLRALPPT
jgi:hypothetical protein